MLIGAHRQALLARGGSRQRERRLRHLVLGCVLGAGPLAAPACGDERLEVAARPGSDASLDALEGGGRDARPDGAADAGGDASDAGAPDSGTASVRVGIVPVPREDAGPADRQLATLEVLAAGSRAVSLRRRFDELFLDLASPNLDSWSELSAQALPLRESGRAVLLCLALVDGELGAAPGETTWDDAKLRRTALELVDRAFGTFGPELAYLSFGQELDRYLALAPPATADALAGLVLELIDYARQHPNRPPRTGIGVTLTADALGRGLRFSTQMEQLVRAADVPVATYLPSDASFVARPPSAVTADLDSLTRGAGRLRADPEQDAGDAPHTPVVLQAVGYPADPAAGGSDAAQQTFYAQLFQVLTSRRERFPFVSIVGLQDAPADWCRAEAAAAGALDTANEANALAYLCSLGLRDRDAVNRPAWDEVTVGLASFASP